MPERWVPHLALYKPQGREWLGNPLTFESPYHSRKEEVNLLETENQNCQQVALEIPPMLHSLSANNTVANMEKGLARFNKCFAQSFTGENQGVWYLHHRSLESKEVRKRSKSDYPNGIPV